MERLRIQPVENHTEDLENFRHISDGEELLADVCREVSLSGPGDIFWIKGMYLTAGRVMDTIYPLLDSSAKNGINVRVEADRISLYASRDIPRYLLKDPLCFLPTQRRAKSQLNATEELINNLEQDPLIDFRFSTQSSLKRRVFPFMGADHVKGILAGKAAYIMDKNIDDTSFFNMKGSALKITDRDIFTALQSTIMNTDLKKTTRGKTIPVNPETQIIFDNGMRNKSVIYENAINMAHCAGLRKGFIGLDTGHTIGGKLLNEILEAHNLGAEIEMVVSNADTMSALGYIITRLSQRNLLKRFPKPHIRLFENKRLHSKNLVTDTEVLTGSHNLIESGIKVGTREIAIRTSNPTALANLRAYHDYLMAT